MNLREYYTLVQNFQSILLKFLSYLTQLDILLHYIILLIKYLWYSFFRPKTYYKQKPKETETIFVPYSHPNKKPTWVKEKVMYLKVHLPNDGCRKIAVTFNRQYAHKNISVSKSYVYRVIKENGYEIVKQRKNMRNRLPCKKVKNKMWHMDLTTIDKMRRNEKFVRLNHNFLL